MISLPIEQPIEPVSKAASGLNCLGPAMVGWQHRTHPQKLRTIDPRKISDRYLTNAFIMSVRRAILLSGCLFVHFSCFGQEAIKCDTSCRWIQDYAALVAEGWAQDTVCEDSTFHKRFRNLDRACFLVEVVLKPGLTKHEVMRLIGKPNYIYEGKEIRWEYYLNTACKKGKYIKSDDADSCWLNIIFSPDSLELEFAGILCQ